jgi:tRNA U34 5-methylaminomethyl-2-thiouridine-forming methyltransferase MnmC
MANIKLIETEDGSHSLVNLDLNEGYHSLRGARSESIHVFIEAGLKYLLEQKPAEKIHIFEVGFGTGLNAWLTYEYASHHPDTKFYYESIETLPLEREFYEKLNFSEDTIFQKMHEVSWGEQHVFGNFMLTKQHQSLQEYSVHEPKADLIYFDAFAPSKQPELWEKAMLEKCFRILAPEGVLVTYSAKGQLKRDLESLGFQVETLPGALGKKEMVRARKMNFVSPS